MLYHNPKVPGCLECRLKSNWKIPVWKNWTKLQLSFGMLKRAGFGILSYTCLFHSERQRKRAIGKETKHKVRISDKRNLPIMQPHCCSPDPALISFQPRSWDILQFSALAAHYRNCRCFCAWVSPVCQAFLSSSHSWATAICTLSQ